MLAGEKVMGRMFTVPEVSAINHHMARVDPASNLVPFGLFSEVM